MQSWLNIYRHRRKHLSRYQLPKGSQGADLTTEYIYRNQLLIKGWHWWKMIILVINLYYLNQSPLWLAFRNFYNFAIIQLLPLNILLMFILLAHHVFKIFMTPVLPERLFELLGKKSKLLLKIQYVFTYDYNGINIVIFILFFISFFLPYPASAWLHLIYSFKLIEINCTLSIIHTKIHTSKVLRVIYRLIMLMLIILYLSHLFATIFYYIDQSLIESQYFGSPADNPSLYYQTNAQTYTPIEMLSEVQRYIMALYFSNGLVSTIAYGDIVGENYIEDAYVTVLMVVSTIIVAFLLEEFLIMVEDNRFAIYDIIKNYRHLQQLMKQKDVPSELQLRIRNYIFYLQYYNKFQNPQMILAKLTSKMKIDLYEQGYGAPIQTLFSPLGFYKIKKVCQYLEEVTYQPQIQIFLPQWKDLRDHNHQARECTLQSQVLEPRLLYLTSGKVYQYLQWGEGTAEFQMRRGKKYINVYEFFAERHVRYGLRTKNIVQFVTIQRQNFDKLLQEQKHFKKQITTLEEQTISNSIQRDYLHDDCEICDQTDHSVIRCPQVHYIIDEHIQKATTIGAILRSRYNTKDIKKTRKTIKSSKVRNLTHFSAIFANISFGTLFQGNQKENVSASSESLQLGISHIQKTIKTLYEQAHIQDHSELNHPHQELLTDSTYDPEGIEDKWKLQWLQQRAI